MEPSIVIGSDLEKMKPTIPLSLVVAKCFGKIQLLELPLEK